MGIINQLEELRALRAKIMRLEGQIEYCREQSMKIPGPVWGEEKIHTHPSGKAPFEKWVLKQLDLEKDVRELQEDFEAKSIKVAEAITSILEDEQVLKAVLYREVSFMKYTEIAEKMKVSKSYIYRLHDAGMEKNGKRQSLILLYLGLR